MIAELAFGLWALASPSCAAYAYWKGTKVGLAITKSDEPLLVLRPVYGAPCYLEEAILSSRVVGPHAHVCFLAAEDDRAAHMALAPLVSALRQEGLRVSLVATNGKGGNPKVAQLVHAEHLFAQEGHRRILVVDADVVLTRSVVSELDAAVTTGAAIAWAAAYENAAQTTADVASQAVLGASLHAFSLLARLDPGGMVGKCFLASKRALDALGGFSPLATVLGEDMELAERARHAGLSVTCIRRTVASAVRGRTLREVFRRYVRWLLVIRHQRPHLLLSYPALFCAFPLQILCGLFLPHGVAFVLFAVLARLVVACAASSANEGRWHVRLRRAIAAPLGDLLLWAAVIGALLGFETRWGNEPLRFDARGYLRTGDPV